MANKSKQSEADEKSKDKKKRSMRCSDDLELIKLILDENGPLRERVLRLLERALNVEEGQKKPKAG